MTARVIDRTLRPNFPKGYRRNTQVICTVLSFDPDYDPAVLSLLGASAALTISSLPFLEPVAGLRIGVNAVGEFNIFPNEEEIQTLDLFLSAKEHALVMVEATANFLNEQKNSGSDEFRAQHTAADVECPATFARVLRQRKAGVCRQRS